MDDTSPLPDPAAAKPSPNVAKPFPGFAQALLVLFLFLFFTGIAGIPAIVIKHLGFTRALPWVFLAGQLSATAYLLWIFTTQNGLQWRHYFPHRPVAPAVWPLVMFATLGIILLSNGLNGLLERILPPPAWLNQSFADLGWQGVVIGAPLTEEPLFRGMLFGGFLQRYGPRKAIAYSALLFALIHMNPWQFPTAILAGLFLGWLMLRTGSIWPCVFGHFINNFTAQLAESLDVPNPSNSGNQPLWMWALGLALAVLAIGALHRVLKNKAEDPLLTEPLP